MSDSDGEPKVEAVPDKAMQAALARQLQQNPEKVKSLINSIDIEALKRAKMAKIMAAQKEADDQPSLTPEVKWAQNPEAISLTVGLGKILRPEIKINGNTLEFFASGEGASGTRRNYEFELDFYDHVDRGFAMRVGPSTVQILVRKDRETCYMWKALTKGPKPNFLKIDAERWIDPDEIQFRSPEEMEKLRLQHLSQQERMMEERYKQILNDEDVRHQAAEANRELTKRCYLFAYSLSMFCGYFFIMLKLLWGIATARETFLNNAYAPNSRTINALQAFTFLESLHCYFGFTGGKVITNLVQSAGRALILFYLTHNDRAQNSEFVFLLFLVWSLADVLRYVYYLFTLMRKRMPRLEWIRYSAFVVLYPLGCIGEMGVIEATIKHMIDPLVTFKEFEWEGSGEAPEDWEAPEPEKIVTEQEPNELHLNLLRGHQYSLPFFVLMMMFFMLKARSKALQLGSKIDAEIAAEKEEMTKHMSEIQERFIAKQKQQLAKAKNEPKKDK